MMSAVLLAMRHPRIFLSLLMAGVIAWVYLTYQGEHYARLKAQAELHAAEHTISILHQQNQLTHVAVVESDHSARTDRVSRQAVAVAQTEIANATDPHLQYLAWTSGIERVRNGSDTGALA